MAASNEIIVESPKDGFVEELFIGDGARVSEGTPLIRMEAEDETRALARVNLSGGLIAIEENLLTPEQIALRRRVFEIAVELTTQYVAFAKERRDVVETQVGGGFAKHVDLTQANVGLDKANAEHEKAKLALKAFEFNTEQAKLRDNLIKSQISEEREYVNQKIARLTITAPCAGVVQLLMGKKSFLRKGHAVCRIHQ